MANHTPQFPAPMPRSVALRLAWLEELEWVVAIDVACTYREMRESGWAADRAAESASHGFLEWFTSRLASAAEVGLVFAMAGDREAA